MKRSNKTAVLCVDDEPQVLQGLRLNLRKKFDTVLAGSGTEALAQLEKREFAIVLSDMRMPKMNGAELLGKVRHRFPDTVRVLLTGQTDMESAILAVNDGQIFRFLTKPCPARQLLDAMESASAQHALLTSQRVLLEQTLRGCISTLTDVLSITQPEAFGRAERVQENGKNMAEFLGFSDIWKVEVAAMLFQIGLITLPDELITKRANGQPLSAEEQTQVSNLPNISAQLVGAIPRLEDVRALLQGAASKPASDKSEDPLKLGAQILRVAVDFDLLEGAGCTANQAMETLREREGEYEPQVLEALSLSVAGRRLKRVQSLAFEELKVGMVLATDLVSIKGAKLMSRDMTISGSLLRRLGNRRRDLPDRISVLLASEDTSRAPAARVSGRAAAAAGGKAS